MNEYIIFMFDDAADENKERDNSLWMIYMKALRESGRFDGGSSIGTGKRLKIGKLNESATLPVTGFIRVRAENMGEAESLLKGNPSYEAGCSVEIRELPKE